MKDPALLLIAIGVVTGLATLAGGSLALRFRSSMTLLLGLGGGALIGMALCDMLPEALTLSGGSHSFLDVAVTVAAGFTAYFALERSSAGLGVDLLRNNRLGAASLILHSLMDGLGIGLAFQVSPATGLIVAAAVLTHDLVDGVNSVTLSLSGGMGLPAARNWLAANALAPLVGIGLSRLVSVPQSVLALVLALFCGFFLYIGAGILLRSGVNSPPRLATIATAVLGLTLVYSIVRIAAQL